MFYAEYAALKLTVCAMDSYKIACYYIGVHGLCEFEIERRSAGVREPTLLLVGEQSIIQDFNSVISRPP
jgi:hypothetical protein